MWAIGNRRLFEDYNRVVRFTCQPGCTNCCRVKGYVYLSEKAQVAALLGDKESAINWWDMALAALEILKGQKGRLALAGVHLALGFEALASSI